jgi:type I restriction enzyme R subunit
VITFVDADLEKLYVFGRLLIRKLPVDRAQLPVEIQQNVDMDSYRLQRTHNGSIAVERGSGRLKPMETQTTHTATEEQEPLSLIIEELNQRFGTDFTEVDKVFIRQLGEHFFPPRKETKAVSQQIHCSQQRVLTKGTRSRPQNRQCSPAITLASMRL